MSELTCLEASVVLWLVHVLVQGAVGNAVLPTGYLATSRDAAPAAAKGVLYGRASRALANYLENLTPFVALALGLIVTQRGGRRRARRDDLDSGADRLHPGLSLWRHLCSLGDMGDLDRRTRDDVHAAGRMVATPRASPACRASGARSG